MPTLNEIRDAIDSRLAALWAHIVSRQNAYYATHGRYFQGVLTPNTPADGQEIAPVLTRKPHDQAETWSAAGYNLGATIPMSIALDTYETASGHGWVGRVRVTVNGRTWARARGAGPDAAHYTHGWREVVP
jgi:hypothetical protein